MGGVQHLFDFNQALAGRRLLSNRKRDNSLGAGRNNWDVSYGSSEALKSNVTTRDELDYEILKSPKKSNGISIKSLIDEELSKKAESRNQTPNIVAQLMGLDALPLDEKSGMRQVRAIAAEATNLQPEKQSQETKLPQLMNHKSARSLAARPSKDSFGSKSYRQHDLIWDYQDDKVHFEASTLHNRPRGQIRAVQRELLARNVHKSRDHKRPAGFKEVEMETASQYIFSHKKSNESKQVNAFEEEYFTAGYDVHADKFSESKEFLDAMEFLQANKELLLKFLQEPNSLFAMHLQGHQRDLRSSSPSTNFMKQKKGHKLQGLDQDVLKGPDQDVLKENDSKSSSRQREFLEPRRYRSNSSLRQLQTDLLLEKDTTSNSLLPDNDFYPRLFQNHERHFGEMGSDEKLQNVDYQVPTRIVVLKPCPRRERNYKHLHSSSPCSPTGLKESVGGFQDGAEDSLDELRERIRTEGKACKRENKKYMLGNLQSHFRNGLKTPREIAREIASQIREIVTRELLLNSKSSTINSTVVETRETFSCTHCMNPGETAVSHDREEVTPFRRLFWACETKAGSNPGLSHKYVKQPDALDTQGGKEGRKRGPGRSKRINVALANEGQLHEDQQVPMCAISSLITHDQGDIDVLRRQQNHCGIGKLMESKESPYMDGPIDVPLLRKGEEFVDSLPRTLPESRSVPVAGCWETVQVKGREEDTIKLHEAYAEKAVASSIKVKKTTSNVTKKTAFREKQTSGPSSFTIEHKRHDNKARGASFNYSSVVLESLKDGCDEIGESEYLSGEAEPMRNFSEKSKSQLIMEEVFVVDEVHSVHQICDSVVDCKWTFQNDEAATTDLDSKDNEKQCTGTDAINNDDNDIQHSILHSSENLSPGKEKLEQPSPVSVLDSPFQEEITSPMGFKGVRSDLHELRLQLPFDNCERSQLGLEAMPIEEVLVMEDCRTKESDAGTTGGSFCAFNELKNIDIKSMGLTEEAYSIGRESELSYLMAVCAISGFTADSAPNVTRWHAPDQPIDPEIFQKIDQYCYRHSAETEEITETANVEKGCIAKLLCIPSRHLLFDCLNEILAALLGRHLNLPPLVMPSNFSNYIMPNGKALVKLISVEACRLLYLHSLSQDTLGNLVTRDLARGNLWMDLTDDIETIGIELDRAIFNDLIADTVISIAKQ